MGVVIDSCVLIECEHGRFDLDAHLAARMDEQAYISVISVSELLHGVHRAVSHTRRVQRSAHVESVLRQLPIIEIDLAVARTHASIAADLAGVGTPVPAHDLWIAASCVAHGHTLVTTNARDFARIPGLRYEVWG